MWVVTREVNAYEQYGEYFVVAFNHKPSFKDLKEALGLSDVTTGKFTRGGGREEFEMEWFHLYDIGSGKVFERGLE